MTLVELRRLLDNAAANPEALDTLVASLRDAVFQGEKRRDPLGAYIVEARLVYRTAVKTDKSKSGKSVALLLEMQFGDAQKLGFDGPFKSWSWLMRIGRRGMDYVG